MNKKLVALPAALCLWAFSLAGCAEAPDAGDKGSAEPKETTSAPAEAGDESKSEEPKADAKDFKACMVSDSGGWDDKSFNQTSHKGLEMAISDLGVDHADVESATTADFATNIQSMVDADCNVIVTVGFLLGDATIKAAKDNPDIDFAIVDHKVPEMEGIKNLKPLVFNTAESSFLAGYLAAAQTQTGKVGTFGGMKIPTVTIFMDGFAQGVAHYNEANGKDVQVIGWDIAKQDGQFVPEPKPFENVAGGKQTAENLKSAGADIIFPVAGPAGEGALQVAQASGGKISAIWVDTDGCESAAKYCSSLMTSVYKGMDVAVFEAIKASMEDTFSSEPYVGTLENDGTGLAPFHDFDAKVSDELKSELEALKADIISGKITIESKSQPE